MSKQTLKKSCLQLGCVFYYADSAVGMASPPVVCDDQDVREVDLERWWHSLFVILNDDGNEPASRPVMVASVLLSRNESTLLMLIICSCNSICGFCTVRSRSTWTAATRTKRTRLRAAYTNNCGSSRRPRSLTF